MSAYEGEHTIFGQTKYLNVVFLVERAVFAYFPI
jgi:hypothetical protein